MQNSFGAQIVRNDVHGELLRNEIEEKEEKNYILPPFHSSEVIFSIWYVT